MEPNYLEDTPRLTLNSAFPTTIDAHTLDCAARFAHNARLMLIEAFKLLEKDTVLSIKAETTGKSIRDLRESIRARYEVVN
jgi:hypothetical protein